MTSEVDTLKTNEFIRRRKLRIQQVREQSKDIAKKIRQRANAEKFKHLVNVDASKEREYLDQQDKFIKKLEELHAKSIEKLGASHKNAAEETLQESKQEKIDLSKQRAREAAAELRRQKQEKLDERKKLLDRKLQAREIANEISREKSTVTASKPSKSSIKISEETQCASKPETVSDPTSNLDIQNDENNMAEVVTNDMATQWDSEVWPNEWEPHVPTISLPQDETPKVSTSTNPESQPDKIKRSNLFAVSDEMPSSLRGDLNKVTEETSMKPSLTLVSEYILNRDLCLREFDSKIKPSKRSTEDLQKLKQTIQRSRAATAEVSVKSQKGEKQTKKDSLESILGKKSSLTMYNHSTRDLRDVPCEDRKFVLRDHYTHEDAYSQAMKETSSEQIAKEKDHQKKLEVMRSKIAMTKQNVEKEYNDTMAFLKSLPKDRPIKNAYKDAQQEQLLKDRRQRKLQHEFRKIQKECRKQAHVTMKPCSKSKFTKLKDSDEEDFNAKDLQYSWMPVPESDGGLAVHIIPTKIKEQRSGNTVKFSKIDSYHEYRSRHKHTPPTKDTCDTERTRVEIESANDQDTDTSSSSTAETSSAEDLRQNEPKQAKNINADKFSDAERIIVYKIIDSKLDKRVKPKKKTAKKNIAKSLNYINKENLENGDPEDSGKEDFAGEPKPSHSMRAGKSQDEAIVCPNQVKEGVYKTVSKKGVVYNILSCYETNVEMWQTTRTSNPWWGNVSCVSFTNEQKQKSPSQPETSNVNRTSKHTVDRGCGCIGKEIETNTVPHTPSSESFKTASNNDKGVLHQHTETKVNGGEGGHIKVFDESSQESGKFFIGASGFLKDSAYEVIIQLRKTDTPKTETDKHSQHIKDNKTVGNQKSATVVEPEKTCSISSEVNSNLSKQTSAQVGVGEHKITSEDCTNTSETAIPKQNNYVDRGVDVPFQDTSYYPKASSDIKPPGTSVSVQTSLDSPEQRYHRMSSSTSTAYMSPPEVILPTYLKQDDYNAHCMYYNTRNPAVYTLNHEPRGYERPSPRKTTKSKLNQSSPVKPIPRSRNFKTPPNTARSSLGDYCGTRVNSSCKKKIPISKTVSKTVKKRKCGKHNNNSKCSIRKTKRTLSINPVAPPSSANNTKTQNSRTDGLGIGTYHFNPVIRWYVDRLLRMNNEGVKAIDVMNQDCSSVSTPGSSVIDNSNNINEKKNNIEPKISLEQLKQLIAKHIVKRYAQDLDTQETQMPIGDTGLKLSSLSKSLFRFPKKRSTHKVKSLNISRSLHLNKSSTRQKLVTNGQSSCPVSGTSSSRDNYPQSETTKQKHRSKSSPSPRRPDITNKVKHKTNSFETINVKDTTSTNYVNEVKNKEDTPFVVNTKKSGFELDAAASQCHEVKPSLNYGSGRQQSSCLPHHSSTQTNRNIDEQINYMKMAEDKIQNMEKIADLTEKCTKRLSNLAKVLEEVRKNKLSYSQASESASDTDQVSGKNSDTLITLSTYEPVIEIKEKDMLSPPQSEPVSSPVKIVPRELPTKSPREVEKSVPEKTNDSPQPKRPKSPAFIAKIYNHVRSPNATNTEHNNFKSRVKPPPALMRRCLKRAQEYVIPHELSTVIEVDSPISTKHKSQSGRKSTQYVASSDSENETVQRSSNNDAPVRKEKNKSNPDLLQTDVTEHKQTKIADVSTDNTKMQMMDLKQFNEIMLKPFISIQEYAKQCNVDKFEEGSNIETLLRGDIINDEMSSLHSDGSLPDVIAELLKRNIISEPFKFDTASNFNSTTVSSDSTLSVLALSKVKKAKKKSFNPFLNKEQMEETSDTLSISSNPDLENAFKKLGMGWASSTLKKTKEHLALSSSSTNTSSSSLSQFKLKGVRNKDFPALVTDSMSSIKNAANMVERLGQNSVKPLVESTKSATQQTSLVNNSLTVKQFLTNELAKRITFGDNSLKNDTEEFVSLYETKMPEEMQRTSRREEHSFDSNPRARTSTPVQIFKSMVYNSSSSSNISNGLFSNADDLSSVKGTSNSIRNHSTSEKDDLTIPNFSLRMRKGVSDCSRSDD